MTSLKNPGEMIAMTRKDHNAMHAGEVFHEKSWILGNRQAWASLLQTAISQLGYDKDFGTQHNWIVEREAAVRALRELCADHGDNDWDEHLHLADIIDKHLARHLQ